LWGYIISIILLSPICFASVATVKGYAIEPKANLKGADLNNAELTNAKLQGANLSNANLTDSQLQCADLTNADLRGVNLKGADITYAKLEGAKLGGAIWITGNTCRKNSIGFCREIYPYKKKAVKKKINLQTNLFII